MPFAVYCVRAEELLAGGGRQLMQGTNNCSLLNLSRTCRFQIDVSTTRTQKWVHDRKGRCMSCGGSPHLCEKPHQSVKISLTRGYVFSSYVCDPLPRVRGVEPRMHPDRCRMLLHCPGVMIYDNIRDHGLLRLFRQVYETVLMHSIFDTDSR